MSVQTYTLAEMPEGAVTARRLMADFMAEMLPAYLEQGRQRWNIDEVALPDPVEVVPRPAGAIDKTPLVAVGNVNDSPGTLVDRDGDRSEYDTTYTLRVFSWVTVDARNVDLIYDMRDRYAACIRAAVLDSPTLKGRPCRVENGALGVSYSDITKVHGDRRLAGSFVTVPLTVHEALVRSSGATVATVVVDGQAVSVPMPPVPFEPAEHPALG